MTRLTQTQLARDIAQFLAFKRALGYPYGRGEAMLRSFQRYVESQAGAEATVELETIIGGWLSRIAGRKPVTVALELGVIRQLLSVSAPVRSPGFRARSRMGTATRRVALPALCLLPGRGTGARRRRRRASASQSYACDAAEPCS